MSFRTGGQAARGNRRALTRRLPGRQLWQWVSFGANGASSVQPGHSRQQAL
ncbi:hypothetical protein Ari01nite_98180 [Paractinoplanes rishiriensis]|uniref:Uncharacterized protein n=1 Tax=Paractinoplanes rishiriensis TaxID=1050105 RepID=A0A919N046_9ACTN|nr:hypothetical protein Ari01nite_98180 [Actinoplanes rishiriensis]